MEDVDRFLAQLADALTRRDSRGYAALWGRASLVIADTFEISPRSVDEIEAAVGRAWEVYDFLDVATINSYLLECNHLTQTITRIKAGFTFYNSSDQHLTDGEIEYTLRRDKHGLRCYVGTHLSAEQNLVNLAYARGYRASYGAVDDISADSF